MLWRWKVKKNNDEKKKKKHVMTQTRGSLFKVSFKSRESTLRWNQQITPKSEVRVPVDQADDTQAINYVTLIIKMKAIFSWRTARNPKHVRSSESRRQALCTHSTLLLFKLRYQQELEDSAPGALMLSFSLTCDFSYSVTPYISYWSDWSIADEVMDHFEDRWTTYWGVKLMNKFK